MILPILDFPLQNQSLAFTLIKILKQSPQLQISAFGFFCKSNRNGIEIEIALFFFNFYSQARLVAMRQSFQRSQILKIFVYKLANFRCKIYWILDFVLGFFMCNRFYATRGDIIMHYAYVCKLFLCITQYDFIQNFHLF